VTLSVAVLEAAMRYG